LLPFGLAGWYPCSAVAQRAPVAGQTRADQQRKGDACVADGRLSPTRVGAVRIGMTTDSVRLLCPIARETYVEEYRARVLVVPIATESLVVWTANRVVERIEVTSPRFRTVDSLGVGSPLSLLQRLQGVDAGVGDGSDVVMIYTSAGNACGLSFRLDAPSAEILSRQRDVRAATLSFRGGGHIIEVNVLGRRKCAP
jgi:hypothetical protein